MHRVSLLGEKLASVKLLDDLSSGMAYVI